MLHVKSLLIFYLLKSTRQVFVCASQKVVIVAVTVNTRAGMYS